MDEYKLAWTKVWDYAGRATRKEFWMFCLVHVIITIALVILGNQIEGLMIVSQLYGFLVFFPILSLSIRRLHDTGRSGWWLLLGLIPVAGFIVLLVFYVQESKKEVMGGAPAA